LNLGLRYEYELAWRESQDRSVRPLDLTKAIPEFQGANAPQIPAQVSQFYNGPSIFNARSSSPTAPISGQWNSGSGTWSPRIGAAYRLNDKTSLRAAYGRYVDTMDPGHDGFQQPHDAGLHQLHGRPSCRAGRAADGSA